MPEQGTVSISDLFQNCKTCYQYLGTGTPSSDSSLNHPGNSEENNEANHMSTLETEA